MTGLYSLPLIHLRFVKYLPYRFPATPLPLYSPPIPPPPPTHTHTKSSAFTNLSISTPPTVPLHYAFPIKSSASTFSPINSFALAPSPTNLYTPPPLPVPLPHPLPTSIPLLHYQFPCPYSSFIKKSTTSTSSFTNLSASTPPPQFPLSLPYPIPHSTLPHCFLSPYSSRTNSCLYSSPTKSSPHYQLIFPYLSPTISSAPTFFSTVTLHASGSALISRSESFRS